MNIKNVWNQAKEIAGRVCGFAFNRKTVAAGTALGATALAHADPVDYGATLTTNLTTINTIWGTVATIMIGVALVVVGVRFFRKAK